jgi:hypothetical protein
MGYVLATGAEGEGEEEEEEGLGPAEPDDYFLLQRSRRGELPATAEFRRAVRQTRAVRARAAAAPRRRWELVGPTNIGGRIVDVAIDPDRPDTI